MKLITEYEFNTKTQCPVFFEAPVYYKDGYVYYLYGVPPRLYCRKIAVDGTAKELSFIVPIPIEIEKLFLCSVPIDERADITLTDCIMKYKNSRSYQCVDFTGKLLWTEKHKGYRYTDFEEVNDCIIFGTAGHGGGLYCYRKSDGHCLCAIDTRGTTRYIWSNNRIVSRGRDGELLFINPFKGKIETSIKLKGLLSDESNFYTDGKKLCVVGFEKKTNSPCVYLFDLQH